MKEYQTERKQRNIIPGRYYIFIATIAYEINRHQNLGIHSNENKDTLSTEITKSNGKYTKPNILSHLASIYDPLGFISPVHLLGKIVYRETCGTKKFQHNW